MALAKNAITRDALSAIKTSFSAIFANAFSSAAPTYTRFTEVVNSSTAIETYAWLGNIPGMREWIGERFKKKLTADAYTLKNRRFESTVTVPREAIEDDSFGLYAPAIKGMAVAAAEHPEELVYQALTAGFTSLCFDGQFFFDTDHPVIVNNVETSVSNMQAGTGPAWFLVCTTRPIKPILYQDRIKAEFQAKDDPDSSDAVFDKDEFQYGTRSRGAAGYTYWQLAFGSKAPLTADNYKAARAAMASLKDDAGRPLNIVPNLLICGPILEDDAKEVLMVQRSANGADNTTYKTAEVLMTPWLA